jgi:putative ABC transport system ATP-binding protein
VLSQTIRPPKLADEPTGEFDTRTGHVILERLQQLNEDFKRTIVVVTHDPRVSEIAHRVCPIEDERIIGETAGA